jgi:hypothetical protein
LSNINILFTCPHGGKKDGTTDHPPLQPPLIVRDPDNFKDIKCPAKKGQGYNAIIDTSTIELTESIIENIIRVSQGSVPYKQIAHYHRKFIDFNRNEICSYEVSSPSAAATKYQEYHDGIKRKIAAMLPQGSTGKAFLFDIHGTNDDKDPNGKYIEVIIGTDHGRSRKALTDDEYWGTNGSNTKSLYKLLRDKNIRAYPPDLIEEQKEDENHSSLDGGYTIKNYGTDGNIPGLIAIQIEVNDCMRKQYVRKYFATDLAECIFSFVEQFI